MKKIELEYHDQNHHYSQKIGDSYIYHCCDVSFAIKVDEKVFDYITYQTGELEHADIDRPTNYLSVSESKIFSRIDNLLRENDFDKNDDEALQSFLEDFKEKGLELTKEEFFVIYKLINENRPHFSDICGEQHSSYCDDYDIDEEGFATLKTKKTGDKK